jgi:CheY-like chemotaxis protein
VAEAGDGREALELARAHRPDVALFDIRMPLLDGLTAAAELRRVTPDAAVVMLATFRRMISRRVPLEYFGRSLRLTRLRLAVKTKKQNVYAVGKIVKSQDMRDPQVTRSAAR